MVAIHLAQANCGQYEKSHTTRMVDEFGKRCMLEFRQLPKRIAMMTKLMTVVALSACMALGSGAAWSCSMAGPNTHIGAVTAVDAAAHTFTVLDAETRQPITFVATPALLKGIAKNQQVTVTFEKDGNKLAAKAIKL